MPALHFAELKSRSAWSPPDGRGWRAALVAGALLLVSAPASAAGFLNWLLGFHHDVEVITATDVTPAGLLRRAPSPAQPIYYVAVSAGYRDLGNAIAGDKLPAPHDMVRTIARVLASQGFLPADQEHPATQCIVFAWGTLYPVKVAWDPSLPAVQYNLTTMQRFLGGDKVGLAPEQPNPWVDSELLPGLTRFNPTAEAIASVAGDDLYVVALAGYEFPVKQPKHLVLLWRTKISCPARGLVLADTLPTMVSIAGPYIGRSTAIPVWVNAADRFKPEVKVGNPKVEEYLDSPSAPIFETARPASEPKRDGKP